jgi:hypothetical protein
MNDLFLDIRIREWRRELQIHSFHRNDEEYFMGIVDRFIDNFNKQGENALILFLTVLKERMEEASNCREDITEVLDELTGSQEGEPDDI